MNPKPFSGKYKCNSEQIIAPEIRGVECCLDPQIWPISRSICSREHLGEDLLVTPGERALDGFVELVLHRCLAKCRRLFWN